MGFLKSDREDRQIPDQRNSGCRRYGWLSGMLLGIVFLGIGAAQGQFGVIWRKAVMICLECIGIG
ncbi:MAG: hypothetical protein K2P48_11275 [Lachnospiraceae bacterium]|nr:hypothetical protein [Lachnospiraceae bacterium]